MDNYSKKTSQGNYILDYKILKTKIYHNKVIEKHKTQDNKYILNNKNLE